MKSSTNSLGNNLALPNKLEDVHILWHATEYISLKKFPIYTGTHVQNVHTAFFFKVKKKKKLETTQMYIDKKIDNLILR